MARTLARPAIDHWRGDQPWLLTLVVSVVAVTYLYSVALANLPALPTIWGIACWAIAGSVLLTWQVVGIWRGINNSSTPPAEVSAIWGGYIAILTAVILVGLAMTDGIVSYLPKPEPQALMTGLTFKVSFNKDNASARLDGDVNYGSKAALVDLLKQRPETKRVVLNSSGGQIFAARAMAADIMRLGLHTHVERRCFSACTIVFMAGTRRTLSAQGQLGFHRYAYANKFIVQTVNPTVEQQKDVQFFRSRGIGAAFLARVFTSRHDQIWTPDHATLRAASVITTDPE